MGGGIEALRRGGVTTSSKLPVAGKFNMARVALTLALFAGARGMSFSGGGDVELGCADSVLSFRLKGQSGCSADGPGGDPAEVFKPGDYGCIVAESAPFGDERAARGKCYLNAEEQFGCYCCLDGGSATPSGLFPYETVGNPVPNCTVW